MAARANTDILAAYLDCVLRKDHTAVDRFFHPDIEYVINGSPLSDRDPSIAPISAECLGALPWIGHYRGKTALKSFLEHMHRNLDVTAYAQPNHLKKGANDGCQRLRSEQSFDSYLYLRGGGGMV